MVKIPLRSDKFTKPNASLGPLDAQKERQALRDAVVKYLNELFVDFKDLEDILVNAASDEDIEKLEDDLSLMIRKVDILEDQIKSAFLRVNTVEGRSDQMDAFFSDEVGSHTDRLEILEKKIDTMAQFDANLPRNFGERIIWFLFGRTKLRK